MYGNVICSFCSYIVDILVDPFFMSSKCWAATTFQKPGVWNCLMRLNCTNLLICLAIFGLSGYHPAAAELYSWIDDNGQVQYSDQVPPAKIERARRVYSDQGQFVSVIEGPKSEEQEELERQKAELEAQKLRELEAEKWYDRMLLGTFLSVKDLEDARDSQISFIDSAILISEHKLSDLRKALAKLDRDAEALEEQGKELPKWMHKRKKSTTEQIKFLEERMARKEQEKQTTIDRFEADIQRFRRLKGQTSE